MPSSSRACCWILLVKEVTLVCAGLKATGLLGVWLQTTALTFAVAPVWLTQLGARLPESTTAQILLVGLVASRFGLWLFDLSVSQMLQEWIPTDDIGKQPDTT